jgi:predicted DNA-binding transcriptional regulator AlpA
MPLYDQKKKPFGAAAGTRFLVSFNGQNQPAGKFVSVANVADRPPEKRTPKQADHHLGSDRLVTINAWIECGFGSRGTILRKVKAGHLPEPKKMGTRSVWLQSQIDEALKQLDEKGSMPSPFPPKSKRTPSTR